MLIYASIRFTRIKGVTGDETENEDGSKIKPDDRINEKSVLSALQLETLYCTNEMP